MSNTKIFLVITVVLLAQISCNVSYQESIDETPIPIEIQVPPVVKRGEEFSILITTEPKAKCHVGVLFWDIQNNWIGKELPDMIADNDGLCKWNWAIPREAKDGIAELRGYIEAGNQSRNLFPTSFCFEVCQ